MPFTFVPILSASIDPKGMTHLTVVDAGLRRAQYRTALSELLGRASPLMTGVVFAENSGADLTEFHALARDAAINPRQIPVEILSVGQNDFPRELGKGYGEFLMIDDAIARSALVPPKAGTQVPTLIVKLTGRLILKNLDAMIRSLPAQIDFAADVAFPGLNYAGRVDTRLMAFTAGFYEKYITGLYREMNDAIGFYAEHAFYKMLSRISQARVLTLLPREPRWIGASGSHGVAYDSLSQRLKYPFKVIRRSIKRPRSPVITPLPSNPATSLR